MICCQKSSFLNMINSQLFESNITSEVIKNIEAQDYLAIDTEFMREKTFFAQLCLIQVGLPKSIYCIDALLNLELKKFWESASKKAWIIHSARQDLEVIYQTTNTLPINLFDTQIASGILGYAPQMGYATLVENLFEVILEKNQTRANWSKRPFTKEMLTYAAEDVEYLLESHAILTEKLQRLGRVTWAEEDSNILINKDIYNTSTKNAGDKIRAIQYLSGKEKKAAYLIAGWREKRAITKDLPRKWILSDRTILDIATMGIKEITDLRKVKNLPASFINNSGDEILKLLEISSKDYEEYIAQLKITEQQKKIVHEMSKIIKEESDKLNIYPEILASKKELKILVCGNLNSRVSNGWRKNIIGNKLLNLMN
ncbi:MAG: ribonuclease D [Woeseiaceae bacterium]|jgi:ribonuclease D